MFPGVGLPEDVRKAHPRILEPCLAPREKPGPMPSSLELGFRLGFGFWVLGFGV